MANITNLSNSLRSELSDTASSFLQSFLSDGATVMYHLDYHPVSGSSLIVKSGNTNISNLVTIVESTGVLTLNTAPAAGTIITVSGQHYRYFTDAEIDNYVNIAFLQHSNRATNAYGSKINIYNLPTVEEYPVVILASTLALFTLATDSSYDIDISAPDGVSIPRSERYRQLMSMIDSRREQYRELCNLLNIGLYRVEVATLRRISQRTNRYVPVYLPQELDDSSYPRRLHVPLPNYMDQTESRVREYDINLYQGDSYEFTIDFPYSLVGYSVLSQIRAYAGADIILDTWNVMVTDAPNGKAKLSLTSKQVADLPMRAIYDVQVTAAKNLLSYNVGTVCEDGTNTGFVASSGVTLNAPVSAASSPAVTPLYGAYALSLTTTSATNSNVTTTPSSTIIPVTGGNSYSITGSARTAAAVSGSRTVNFYVDWYDSKGNLLSSSTALGGAVSNSTWTSFISGVLMAPNSASYAVYRINVPTSTIGDTIYIDKLGMFNGPVSAWFTPTVDGSDTSWQQTYIKGTIITEREVTSTNHNPYASGWMG